MADRTIVRGRRGAPAVDRLPLNDSGYEQQPTRFNSGMWAIIMFVGSELMFFAALFTTYFFLRGKIPAWEPVFGEKPSWQGLPLINTIELVTSSVTMQLAVSAIRKGDRRRMIQWLIPTLILGIAFWWSNPTFRAKRIAQECGPITDPQLKQSCEASFQCGAPQRRSNKAPPSMTVR